MMKLKWVACQETIQCKWTVDKPLSGEMLILNINFTNRYKDRYTDIHIDIID